MRLKWGFIIAATAALPAVAMAQGGQQGQYGQSQAGQDTTQMNRQMSDTTAKKHHRKHHRAASTGEVSSDTTKNQSQSGVVNQQGQSTLGRNIKKTTPTEGQPVTSKGDTLRRATDTTGTPAGANPHMQSDSSHNMNPQMRMSDSSGAKNPSTSDSTKPQR
jgi:hypothetical protein